MRKEWSFFRAQPLREMPAEELILWLQALLTWWLLHRGLGPQALTRVEKELAEACEELHSRFTT